MFHSQVCALSFSLAHCFHGYFVVNNFIYDYNTHSKITYIYYDSFANLKKSCRC